MTVIWRLASTRRNPTRMMCTLCRTAVGWKCRHEIVCEKGSRDQATLSGDEYSGEDTDKCGEGTSGPTNNNGAPDLEEGESGGIDHDDEEDVENNEREVPAYGGASGRGKKKRGSQLKKASSYFPERTKRSFMMCDSEKKLAELLTNLIEPHAEGRGYLVFGDPDGTQCLRMSRTRRGVAKRCVAVRVKSTDDVPRTITLFTLNHDDVSVVLLDWVCPTCGHLKLYQGAHHGIFPTEYGVGYTVELMYWWVHEMCLGSKSFRTVYGSSRKLQLTASYRRRFETGRVQKLPGARMHNRRNANTTI